MQARIETTKRSPYGRKSIKAIIDERLATGTVEDNTKSPDKKSAFEKLTEDEIMLIRKTIHVKIFSKFIKGALWDSEATYPTISYVHKVLMDLGELPQWSETTTYNILIEMGFKWLQDHVIDCAAIIERVEIREWRKIYLTKMKRYREEGVQIH